MIEDKKRKTRRVSKKVKKMHEDVVSKGIIGATPPESKTGGGPFDAYKIDIRRSGEVIESDLKSEMQLSFISLRDMLKKLEDKPGSYYRIEKSADPFKMSSSKIYRFEEL